MAIAGVVRNTTSLDKPGGGEVSKVKNKKIRPTKKPIDFGLDKFFIKKGAKLIAPYKIKFSK